MQLIKIISWLGKCLRKKTENGIKIDKSLQSHVIKKDSFAFSKDKDKIR